MASWYASVGSREVAGVLAQLDRGGTLEEMKGIPLWMEKILSSPVWGEVRH